MDKDYLIHLKNSLSKLLLSIILFCAIANPINAQQDTVKDFFPLAIGNRWIYNFDLGWATYAHTRVEDKGTAEYEIIGKDSSSNRTTWHFIREEATMRMYIKLIIRMFKIPLILNWLK